MMEAALLVALTVEHGSGTAACLQTTHLERAVEQRLQRRVFASRSDADLAVRVRFVKQGSGIAAHIEIARADGTPRGSRTLTTQAHCSALDDSIALSLALLVDEPPEPEPAPLAEAPAPSAPPAAAVRTGRVLTIPADVAAPREPWHLALGATAKVAWGALPDVRPALALHLLLEPRGFWPILAQGEAFFSATRARNDSSGARFRLLRAGLAVCPELSRGQGHGFSLCLGQRLSWLSVEGYGFDRDASQRRLGVALSLAGEGRLRLFDPIWLRAGVGPEIPLVRDRFTSGGRDAQELFAQSPVALSGELGLEAKLW